MALSNQTEDSPLLFILRDIPGLGSAHRWLVIPLGSLYLVSFVGNGTILGLVWAERGLHAPMYLFLCMLALADLGLSASTLPSMLSVFLLRSRVVAAEACFAQLFSIHTFSVIESAVLLAMAFDRFVAIWNPLRYTSILTSSTVTKMGAAIVLRSVSLHLPLPFMLRELRYGKAKGLSHSYCVHPDVLKLACVDTRVNSAYGLFVLLSTLGLDFLLILLSYAMILKMVLSLAAWRERLKALNTCVSHICAVLLFYTPLLSLSMIHRFGKKMPPQVYLLLSYLHFLLPPVLNPVIYSVKTKEIRRRQRQQLKQRRVSPVSWELNCNFNAKLTKCRVTNRVGQHLNPKATGQTRMQLSAKNRQGGGEEPPFLAAGGPIQEEPRTAGRVGSAKVLDLAQWRQTPKAGGEAVAASPTEHKVPPPTPARKQTAARSMSP
ncbi:olfactory receptor 51G2-like [Heteronotia binoei]|uniref:olfactory receptor 51G2-like n=1 Tax=Heteronotia binoei TaxID=13085 RepID=UPI00292D222F|nr:olfactory receptor 51G2-like [Heteronotia binoei]